MCAIYGCQGGSFAVLCIHIEGLRPVAELASTSSPPQGVGRIKGRLEPSTVECEWIFKPVNSDSASVQADHHQSRERKVKSGGRNIHPSIFPLCPLLCTRRNPKMYGDRR